MKGKKSAAAIISEIQAVLSLCQKEEWELATAKYYDFLSGREIQELDRHLDNDVALLLYETSAVLSGDKSITLAQAIESLNQVEFKYLRRR